MHFEIIRTNDVYVFQLLEDNNLLMAGNTTYQDPSSCMDAIRNFIQLAATAANYITHTESGNYLFAIQTGDTEIARSIPYDSMESVNISINRLIEQLSTTSDYEVNVIETRTQSIQRPGLQVDLDAYDFTQLSRSGKAGFEVFQSAKNNLYYFHFNNSQGQPILYSQAYASETTRNNGIWSVIQNADKEKRYERKETDTGAYFILKAINGREIARSNFFATATERDEAIQSLQKTVQSFADNYRKPEKTSTRNGNPPVDKYNFTVVSQSGQAGFESFQSADTKQYYFHFNDADGQAILYSQGYGNIAGRDNGIRSVIKNAYQDARYVRNEEEGKHYFILKAGNNQEIARSPLFDTTAAMEAAILFLKNQSVTYASRYQVDVYTEELHTVETQRLSLHVDHPEPVTNLSEKSKRTIDQYDFTQRSPVGIKGFEPFYSKKNNAYYFHYNNDQGTPILFSESYPTAQTRDNGLESVKRNAPIESRWKVQEEDGRYFYSLKAGNSQEIARSPFYESREIALANLALIQTTESVTHTDMETEPLQEATPSATYLSSNGFTKEEPVLASPIMPRDIPAPKPKTYPQTEALPLTSVSSTSPLTEPAVATMASQEITSTGPSGWVIGGVVAAILIGGVIWYTNYQSNTTDPTLFAAQANKAEPVVKDPEQTSATLATTIENFQPIALYFNNDQPNPKTKTNTTELTYGQTYTNYYNQKDVFVKEYSKGSTSTNASKQEVENFFDTKVQKGYNDLVDLSDKLLAKLKEGNKVEITVTGFASPLAEGDYNKMLTGRRVSSIENHFRTYKDGQFKEYMDKGLLVITEQASGEDNASGNISDNRDDVRSSLYSPSASEERRVEITNVTIQKAN
ncbi:DUF1508 domain-containing protein [Xanthocytophaga flava]|uniref:DUF1508 domain-containing protein n=1 Tax=Xanthocytophaga flava TaxID=3048013 RepID=UPI0028D5454E|nr:DUF1508 domain-containing protein [Xanthocytophaga flavus]MDJ1473576.1 DUF1508 domain-containing protein [Xanthocytophaga flavus]